MSGINTILPKCRCLVGRLFPWGQASIWILALSIGIGLACPYRVNAFILQGPYLLELMVRTMDSAQSMRVEQKIIVEDSAIADHPLEISETLIYLLPDRFRSESRYQETYHRIHVTSAGESITIVNGRRINGKAARFDRYADLLLYRSRPQLHKVLLAHGVDVEKTSLGRSDDAIVYVLGAQYPDESVSQVWVDKERFLPLRWLDVSTSDSSDRLEFFYLDWRKKGDLWYPMRVETYHNKRLIRRISVTSLEISPSLSLDLFDIPHFNTVYPPAAPVDSSEPDKPNSANEVKRAIEEFQKKFED